MAYAANDASNGFGRRHLRKDEAWVMCQTGYPCPPDMRVPGASVGQGSWHLSTGGVPVPPIPTCVEFDYAIAEVRRGLTEEQAVDPRWRAENNFTFWDTYFQRRHAQDLADHGDNGQVEGRFNSKGRKWWSSARGRTI